MSDRQKLFEKALHKSEELSLKHPNVDAFISISRQLEYLLNLELGVDVDRSRLREIVIGVLTAREVEPLDEEAADLFYQVSGEAKRM